MSQATVHLSSPHQPFLPFSQPLRHLLALVSGVALPPHQSPPSLPSSPRLPQYYELVLYTSQLPTYADPILDRLDPQRTIQYRRARSCTALSTAWAAADWGGVQAVHRGPQVCCEQPPNAQGCCVGVEHIIWHAGPRQAPPYNSTLSALCRLYRDSTQYKDGKHVRDLSKLNRDMRQVGGCACGAV